MSNDDQLKSFTYSRQVDGRGQAFAPGEWGTGYRPETLRSFVLGSSTTVELGMPHSGAVDAGWSSEAVSTVLGTYAASHTGKTDETVYAVRETDGSVRKLTKDAWNELREAAKLPLPTA